MSSFTVYEVAVVPGLWEGVNGVMGDALGEIGLMSVLSFVVMAD